MNITKPTAMKIFGISTIAGLLILMLLGVLSCKKEDETAPYEGRIKRVLRSWAIEDTAVRFIDEYQYDAKKRLVKIQNSLETQVFEYNNHNKLCRKLDYYTSSGAVTLTDTTFYAWKDDHLIYEITDSGISYGVVSITRNEYEYEGEKLIRKKTYRNGRFWNMMEYKYTGERLTKEITYEDSLGLKLYSHAIYGYDDDQLALKSEWHSSGECILSSYYFYNEHGDLSMAYAIQNQYISALLSYYNRYEYY